MDKISRSLMYVADAVESGYTAVFTFGIKELLDTKERQELSSILRDLAASRDNSMILNTNLNRSRKL